jgi:outer membrane protein OmpA-like peptidoglycan-associated protein
MISKYAGVRNSSATMILGIVASICLDKLGKVVQNQGFDKLTLANYLLEQKNNLLDETPAELQPRMIDVLGLSVFMSQEIKPIQFAPAAPIKSASLQQTVVEKPVQEHKVTYSNKNYEESESNGLGNIPKWLLPAVLIVAMLSGLGYFVITYDWKSLSSSSDGTTDSAQMEEVTGAEIDTSSLPKDTSVSKIDTSAMVKDGALKTVSLDLPNGQKIDLADGSFVYTIAKYLTDSSAKVNRVFTFDHLSFEPNTAALTLGSDKTVTDLAKVMQAFPRAQVKLTAYTDNTVDSLQSKRLSARRAVAVRNILIQQGINAIRIDFVGKGSQNPIASNITEEGKAKNRRIELKVVRK